MNLSVKVLPVVVKKTNFEKIHTTSPGKWGSFIVDTSASINTPTASECLKVLV